MTCAPAPFAVEVITCVAEAWPALLGPNTGLVGRAFAGGQAKLTVSCLRTFGAGRHRQIDDAPYGGGAGMVLAAPPLLAAIAAARARTPGPVILLAPRGAPLTQRRLQALAEGPGFTLICGRYEGVDERVYGAIDEALSLGDFVLSGGDPAALCVIDGAVRLRAGVLGNACSTADESFADGLLEYPHYTRPASVEGAQVPAVLQGGNHAAIAAWRRAQSCTLTQTLRPDLWAAHVAKHTTKG